MMSRKNIIIFILLSSFSMMKMSAQEGRRFEPQVRFSYEKGVNKMKPSTYSVEFIAGLRTSEQTRIGIGIGYAGNSHLFKDYSYIMEVVFLPNGQAHRTAVKKTNTKMSAACRYS